MSLDVFRAAERLMAMDDAAWARHANPWSVWTRFATAPLIALAVWSRVWLGWWSLAPLAAALAWTWANPRLFPPPATMDGWPQRAVLGERLWLDRATRPPPAHHLRAGRLLTAASLVGALTLAWGLAWLAITPTLVGLLVAVVAKAWFADRMVWLHADMRRDVRNADAPSA